MQIKGRYPSFHLKKFQSFPVSLDLPKKASEEPWRQAQYKYIRSTSLQEITPSEEDILALYFKSNIETCIDIRTTHPQVAGFVFLEKDILTKAYFPKNTRNWSAKSTKYTTTALTRCPSSYTAFSVDDMDNLINNTYFFDTPKSNESINYIASSKLLKENKKNF